MKFDASPRKFECNSPGWWAVIGFTLTLFGWHNLTRSGLGVLPYVDHVWAFPLVAVAGGALALTRFRPLVLGLGAASGGIWLIVNYTPLADRLAPLAVVADEPAAADAVVVLASRVHLGGDLSPVSRARGFRGVELVRQGYAPRMVVAEPVTEAGTPSHAEALRAELTRLDLSAPPEVIDGKVANTREEAVRVAELAKERGWRKILLVTSPIHTRRAVACFRKTGLSVLSIPSAQDLYDVAHPREGDRRRMLGDWMHEVIGYKVYRRRGWL